jgi:hypothetical protein
VRLAETRPRIRGQGELELDVTSYELFRRIAKMAVRELDIPRSKDPDVGHPIPLSPADRLLTPRRFQEHLRDRATGRSPAGAPRRAGASRERARTERRSRGGDQADGARDERAAAADDAR